MTTPDKLLTIEEAADYLRVSSRTLRRRMADGGIRVVRHGRAVRIDPSDLAKFISTHKTSGPPS